LPPATIKDPEAKKPEDWVDEAKIPDPEDKKPANWDDIPEFIADPEATKPEDWDDETDGDWEAPLVENPEYRGEWQPRMIDNPDYKGPWVHPTIPNPEYTADPNLYAHTIGGVGIELWQVKSGTFFDSVVVADSREEADALLALKNKSSEGEKAMKDQVLEAER
jgi:calreticulin